MRFVSDEKSLTASRVGETIRIEAWGKNALRVRATRNAKFSGRNNALEYAEYDETQVFETHDGMGIKNGRISCEINKNGVMTFFRDGKRILKEYSRSWENANEHSPSMKLYARAYKPVYGGDYSITVRFESSENEKIYGMGQYQQEELNLKGCILELAQRNSQISIPFYLSSLGYGFLWNNQGTGEAVFGANYTKWHSEVSEELDYWITADSSPKDIIKNYTEVTGRSPVMPDDIMGLWQSKLRYRTQEEVLEVAREYKRRNIPLDVIVIDFFHWIRQGDWSFDPEYWPDPAAMVKELKEMGTRCMISIWPTVDRKSVNFNEMWEKGLLVRTERGSVQCFDFQGDTVIYDATNPEARNFIWDKCRENYYNYGIDMFWLDEAEPEYSEYDFDHFRYYAGPAVKTSNEYPKFHAQAFYEGQKKEGQENITNLLRCAWVGSQKYAAVVWSGDVKSNFTSLRDQFAAGLNIGIAGIPWWTTDTGGFFGDIKQPHFNELLIRWFQFSVFSPILRLHGDRGPHNIPRLSELDYGGGFSDTGQPNELWSYGEEVYGILKKYLDIRLSMKDYIKKLNSEASETGSPIIRTMFYEFPDDPKCWECGEQYMFGDKYLVAPVMYQGMTEREIYLPMGQWRNIHTGEVTDGERNITVKTPIDIIPVFERL